MMQQGRVQKISDPSGISAKMAAANPTYEIQHSDIIGSGAAPPQFAYRNRHADNAIYENWQSPANREERGGYVNMKTPTDMCIRNNNSTGALVSDNFGTDDAYKQLRKQSSALVNQDKDVFVRTGAYQRAEDLLKGHGILVIRGTPACGKSALGLSLLRHFAVSGFAPLVLHSFLEWRNHIRRNLKQSVLLDCVLGEVKVERARYEEWLPLFNQLRSVVRDNPNCLLVIILHTHVMAQFDSMTKTHRYFRDIPLVDLDDLPMDLKHKEAILTKHMATRNINLNAQVTRDIVSRERCGPLFPLCCASFVRDFSRDQYVNLRYDHEVFTSPGLAYVKFFTAVLKDPESWKDLVPLLILAMNKSGFVLGQEENLEAKLRMLGLVTIDVDLEGIKMWAVLLKGSVLSSDMKQFRNRDLGDGFSFALFKNHSAELFLNACDVQFLINHVHVEPTSRRSDIVLDSASPFFPKLQERFCQEILNDNIVQISQHPALQNSKFLEEFEAFLYRKQCFKAVMSAQDGRHKLSLLYWSAWSGSGVLTCWCLSKMLSEDAGRLVRQTFLVCSLSGEKLDTPRMTRMFQWLCAPENKAILNDAISAVALPMPAAEDRLCKEVRAKVQEVLDGPTVFTCGLSKNQPIYYQPGDSTIIVGLLPKRRDDAIHPVSSQRVTEVPGVSPLMSSADGSGDISNHGRQGGKTTPPPPPPPQLFAFPQHSDVGSFVSESMSSSSGSGSYISFLPAPFHQALNMMQGRALSIIAENDTEEGAEDSRNRSAGTGGLERGQRGGSFSIVLSDKSGTITSTAQLQSGKPVPPSIVKISVDKDEGKVILEPFCVRWYTFLRLVSLCEVDEQNREGYTLLHTAAYQGELNVVRFLVDTGADLAVLTQKGNTALTKAVDLNRVDVASFLLEEGSKAVLVPSTNPAEGSVSAAGNSGSWDLSWMMGTQEPFNIFSKIVQKRRAQMLHLFFNYDIRPKRDAEMDGLLKEAASVNDNHAVVRLLTDFRHHHSRRGEMVRNAAGQGGGVDHGSAVSPQVRSERPTSTSALAAQKPATKKGFKGFKRILHL